MRVKMREKLFEKLWADALAQPSKELYIAEYGYPDWYDEISQDPDEITAILGNIHDVAHMDLRAILKAAGLKQVDLCRRYGIPRRTVDDWTSGRNRCADYMRLLLARDLGLISIKYE